MELVDRYLKAVRFWLPKARQENILAELSENIRAQIDEKEAELGRKRNEADTEAQYLGAIISGIVSALAVLSELRQLVRPPHGQAASRA
jgi:hypothetical protein